MKRARPPDGVPRKDHLFTNNRSLCGRWTYSGGEPVEPDELDEDEPGLCKTCVARAISNGAGGPEECPLCNADLRGKKYVDHLLRNCDAVLEERAERATEREAALGNAGESP